MRPFAFHDPRSTASLLLAGLALGMVSVILLGYLHLALIYLGWVDAYLLPQPDNRFYAALDWHALVASLHTSLTYLLPGVWRVPVVLALGFASWLAWGWFVLSCVARASLGQQEPPQTSILAWFGALAVLPLALIQLPPFYAALDQRLIAWLGNSFALIVANILVQAFIVFLLFFVSGVLMLSRHTPLARIIIWSAIFALAFALSFTILTHFGIGGAVWIALGLSVFGLFALRFASGVSTAGNSPEPQAQLEAAISALHVMGKREASASSSEISREAAVDDRLLAPVLERLAAGSYLRRQGSRWRRVWASERIQVSSLMALFGVKADQMAGARFPLCDKAAKLGLENVSVARLFAPQPTVPQTPPTPKQPGAAEAPKTPAAAAPELPTEAEQAPVVTAPKPAPAADIQVSEQAHSEPTRQGRLVPVAATAITSTALAYALKRGPALGRVPQRDSFQAPPPQPEAANVQIIGAGDFSALQQEQSPWLASQNLAIPQATDELPSEPAPHPFPTPEADATTAILGASDYQRLQAEPSPWQLTYDVAYHTTPKIVATSDPVRDAAQASDGAENIATNVSLEAIRNEIQALLDEADKL